MLWVVLIQKCCLGTGLQACARGMKFPRNQGLVLQCKLCNQTVLLAVNVLGQLDMLPNIFPESGTSRRMQARQNSSPATSAPNSVHE